MIYFAGKPLYVGEHALAQFAIRNELGLEPKPGERGAKIVRDCSEHMGALAHEALETLLHVSNAL